MKKRILITMVVASSLLLTSGCKKETVEMKQTTPAFDLAAAKTAIEARDQLFAETMNKKDSVGLANCYTTDAKFMQPNAKAVEGRPAIQKLIGQWMKAGMPTFAITTANVWGDENYLTAENTWSFSDKDGKVLDSGKALELYKMEDGVWKLYRDCYNSDMPVPKK